MLGISAVQFSQVFRGHSVLFERHTVLRCLAGEARVLCLPMPLLSGIHSLQLFRLYFDLDGCTVEIELVVNCPLIITPDFFFFPNIHFPV